MTITDYDAACEALKAWFKSQDIEPCEAMMILSRFTALMIVDNATSDKNIEEKLNLLNLTIRSFIVRESFRQ